MIEAALVELQRYLQDEIPPPAAAPAVAMLMAQPTDVLMQHVANWSAEQAERGSVSALLLHALKKVYITGELRLLDREAVANYLDRATSIALRICPMEERDGLRANIASMRVSRDTTANRVDSVVVPPRLKTQSGQVPVPDDESQTAKRLSLILERLTRPQMGGGGLQPPVADPQAIAQYLTMAASNSKSGQQFNDYLEQIRPLTEGAGGKNVFVILGGAMPSWDMPNLVAGGQKAPSQIGAMEKIIELAADPIAAGERFRELVAAAMEKFNDGSLAAAVWMLDVAQDSITEKKLDAATVTQIRAEAVESIDQVQLRKYTENRGKHAALRIALEFFPTLRLESLFQRLRGEQRAEKRRSLLGLIEAHGVAGRDFSLDSLESEVARGDVDTYYLRNLIYLLHRIVPASDKENERELQALALASNRGQNIYVIKEAASALGQIRTDASVKLLTTRLAEFEAMLLRSDTSVYPIGEMQKLLDRIISALARIGTTASLLTVARHGMKVNALLGDTRMRLTALAQHDLSFDEETVALLLKALRDEIPGKFLGRLIPKKQEATVQLIDAISGTRSDAVEAALTDIAERFPDQEIGTAAAAALEKQTAKVPRGSEAAATLQGELEFFGLPSLMQSIGEMRATGMLTLSAKQGPAVAKLVFVDGKFLNAQRAQLRGADAVYDILERPIAGRFSFVPQPSEKLKSTLTPSDIMPLLLEGVRRHDELQQMIAMIPDSATFTKTAVKPTPHEDETDPSLMREVWLKATSGTTVGEWTPQIAADSFRIRRLLSHWLETGSLLSA